jgi:hypothetical protein
MAEDDQFKGSSLKKILQPIEKFPNISPEIEFNFENKGLPSQSKEDHIEDNTLREVK